MKPKSMILTVGDHIYDLDPESLNFINNGEEGESVITAEFTDDEGEYGTIHFTPLLEILSIQYDLPF